MSRSGTFIVSGEEGGRKSFRYEEIDRSYRIRAHKDMFIHFLEPLKEDLLRRDREREEEQKA